MKTLLPRTSARRSHPAALVRATVLVATLLLAGPGAQALPISPDLTITGSVGLSTTIGNSTFSDGDVTQTGQIRVKQGGVTTSGAFSTAPGTADGVDDATTTPPGTNPLLGSLTEYGVGSGDGVGYTSDLDAAFETGFAFNEGYDFVVAFLMDLANASLTDTYTITIRVDYSNVVDADGNDAWAGAGLDVELDNVDQLLSDVLSDTLLGDELNGVLTGTFGNAVSDVGTFFFDVILAPGATRQIGGQHQWEGGVFETGASRVDVRADITLDNIVCSGPNNCQPIVVTPVPEPAVLALFGVGLAGLGLARRRRGAR